MTYSDAFLGKDLDETEELVLRIARAERAPVGAQGRALARLAGPAGVGAALTGKIAGASASSGSVGLVAKCMALGLGVSLTTLGVVKQVRPPVESAAIPAVARDGDANRAKALSEAPLAPMQGAPTPDESARAVPTAARLPAGPRKQPRPAAVAEPRAASRVQVPAPSVAQLTREVAALKVARASLARGDGQQALMALKTYRAEFPAGELGAEAAALQVEATWALGDRTRAVQLADSFLKAHPASPLGARIRSLIEPRIAPITNRDRSPDAGQ